MAHKWHFFTTESIVGTDDCERICEIHSSHTLKDAIFDAQCRLGTDNLPTRKQAGFYTLIPADGKKYYIATAESARKLNYYLD